MADPEQDDREAIKRLLILLLLKVGATSNEIGLALDMHAGAVRKIIPAAKIKKIDFGKVIKG